MIDTLNIRVKDIIEHNPTWLAFNHDIAIIDLKDIPCSENRHSKYKIRMEALSVIVVLDGKLEITINGNDYKFESNVLCDIAKLHTCGNISMSEDCRGYHVVLSADFTKEIMTSIQKISISTFLSRYSYPVEMLNSEESNLLEDRVLRIINSVKREGHNFHRDLIKNDVRSFILEMMNIISKRNNVIQIEKDRGMHNKNKLVGKFIFLLDEHCKEERNVEFYADKLCVDPKHLSRILKSFNGKPATAWIAEALLKEAKIYLRDQNLTIQQVADQLNFSDQSSFGKFFKKQCGISPLNYRLSNNE